MSSVYHANASFRRIQPAGTCMPAQVVVPYSLAACISRAKAPEVRANCSLVGGFLMNITKKPIRRCNGCGLNLRSHCGVFDAPRLMWDRGKCPGYNNEEMLMRYKATRGMAIQAKQEARRKRQEVQALRKTEPHHSGQMYTVVTSDKPADRKKSVVVHVAYAQKGTRTARAPSVKAARHARVAVAKKGR